jgi:hypothetical protein
MLDDTRSASSALAIYDALAETWPGEAPPSARFYPGSLARKTASLVNGPGRLAPQVVARILTEHLRHLGSTCYIEDKAGQIRFRIHVAASGDVARVADDGSNFPDQTAIACTMAAYENVRFPVPDGGELRILYEINIVPD